MFDCIEPMTNGAIRVIGSLLSQNILSRQNNNCAVIYFYNKQYITATISIKTVSI